MLKKLLVYTLPLYLYGLEFLLKQIASVQSDSLAGPTLAGAALRFLLPLTELKKPAIDPFILEQLKAAGASAYIKRDKRFSDFVWVCFFAALGAWILCIYLTLKPLREPGKVFNESFAIGCILFLISIVLAEIKERL